MSLDLDALLARVHSSNTLPPVHQWKPTVENTIDIVIDLEGRWIHEGELIERQAICKLLSSILVFENESYYLKTPVEKVAIQVMDVPFVAEVVIDDEGANPYFVTQTEDIIPFDAQMESELRNYQGVDIPYIKVRDNLFARLSRSLFFAFADDDRSHKVIDGLCFYQQKDGLLPLGRLKD